MKTIFKAVREQTSHIEEQRGGAAVVSHQTREEGNGVSAGQGGVQNS